MSGAGWDLAAYFDLGGLDASASLSDPRRVTKPVAARFDGASRAFLFDDDGRLLAEHPVDQGVALALLTEYGRMTAAPGSGTRIKTITYAGGPRLEEQVKAYCREAVKRWTDAGDIREESITVTVPARGSLSVVYAYVRLKDSGDRRRGVPGRVRVG
jgi:hypothetical protein